MFEDLKLKLWLVAITIATSLCQTDLAANGLLFANGVAFAQRTARVLVNRRRPSKATTHQSPVAATF
jgi:hypothetical protein